MSHYAIIKRRKYISEPKWFESLDAYRYSRELQNQLIKFESFGIEYIQVRYKNVIADNLISDSIITYWIGEINQLPLSIGETLVIEDEHLIINKVDKHVDGTVTYQVDDMIVNSDDYDDLLLKCEEAYDAYSKLLKHEKEELNLEKEIKLNDNYQKELIKSKPWWIRIF